MKVNGYDIAKGAWVYCEVEWQGGRRTSSEGTLIAVVDDKAYVETAMGPVEVDVNTVEPMGAPER